MGYLNTGAIGSSPSVTWIIEWSGSSSQFDITCQKNGDGQFYNPSGTGWTVYVGFEGGNVSSTYINAPSGGRTDVTYSYGTVYVNPPTSGTLYFYTTSQNFTSSGVIAYASRKTASYVQAFTVTVQDRVGSSSGTLLGSGSYSVNYGTTTNARSLRTASYSGYTYVSNSGNATITGNTTLYNYYSANTYNIYYYKNDDNGTVSGMPSNGTIAYNSYISNATPTNSYVITLNANGGVCSTSSVTGTRTFNSWNTAANGTGTAWAPGALFKQTSALYLYAQWGDVSSVVLPTPTRTGYEFVGWGVTSSSTSGYPAGVFIPTGTTTLFAIWKANGIIHVYKDGSFHSYLVWLYKGDGSGPNSNGWHHVMPKIYCTSGGSTKFHTCG